MMRSHCLNINGEIMKTKERDRPSWGLMCMFVLSVISGIHVSELTDLPMGEMKWGVQMIASLSTFSLLAVISWIIFNKVDIK